MEERLIRGKENEEQRRNNRVDEATLRRKEDIDK